MPKPSVHVGSNPSGSTNGPVMQPGRHTAFRPQVLAGSTPARPTNYKGDLENGKDRGFNLFGN